MDINDMYLSLIDIIKNLYEEYNYLKMSKKEYNEIVFKCLNKIKLDLPTLSIDELYIYFDAIIRDELEKITEDAVATNSIVKRNENTILEWNKYNIDIYLDDVRKYKVLNDYEINQLYDKINKGDKDLKQLIVCSNLGLVIKIAKRYRYFGVSFLDLIQEGNIGLMKAVDKFNPVFNSKFSVFVGKCIEGYILRAIENTSRNIRIPSYLYRKFARYRKTRYELESYIDNPTLEQLAEKLNISKEEVEKLKLLEKNTESMEFLNYYEEVINNDSLEDYEIKFDEEKKVQRLMDNICDNGDSVEKDILVKCISSDINLLLKKAKISKKNIEILKLYYGNEKKTFVDIAKLYNVSDETIRRNISSSLKKIRKTEYIYKLASYMEDEQLAKENIKKYRKLYSLPGSYKKPIF